MFTTQHRPLLGGEHRRERPPRQPRSSLSALQASVNDTIQLHAPQLLLVRLPRDQQAVAVRSVPEVSASQGRQLHLRLCPLDRPPDAFGRCRHIDMLYAQWRKCIANRTDHRSKRPNRTRLPCSLGTDRIG